MISEGQDDATTFLWKAAFILTLPVLIWGGRLVMLATRPPSERRG